MMERNNILKDFIGEFLLSVAKHGMTLFTGAGISVISPCLCPTWDRLKKTILDEFMSKLIENDWSIKNYLCGIRQSILEMEIRPETFLWGCEQILGHNSVIEMIRGLNSSVPNYNHESIALLARDGYVKSIITTNFETYIERSLLSNKVKFTLARDSEEVESLIRNPNNGIPLFKPHGCLSKPSSMIYKIDDIQKLTNSYEELMYSLLKCTPVLIVGYSGNDEDIFPVLQRVLEESPFPSLICVYPESTLNEPIVKWDIVNSSKIKHFRVHADTILRCFLAILNKDKQSTSELLKNISTNTKSGFGWQDQVNQAVKRIPHDKIAITISHLCSIHGNHQRALSFANLAEDICDNPTLSPNPDESLQIIRNIQSISYAEQNTGNIPSTALQNRRIKEALKKNSANEVAMTLIDRSHMALRDNDLKNAEKALVTASKILTSNVTPTDHSTKK